MLFELFRNFDSEGKGFLNIDEFKNALTSLGEPMTADEVDNVLNAVNVNEGKFKYEDLIKIMC